MTMGIITARKRDNITQTTQAMASNVETMGFANPPVVVVEITLVATVPN